MRLYCKFTLTNLRKCSHVWKAIVAHALRSIMTMARSRMIKKNSVFLPSHWKWALDWSEISVHQVSYLIVDKMIKKTWPYHGRTGSKSYSSCYLAKLHLLSQFSIITLFHLAARGWGSEGKKEYKVPWSWKHIKELTLYFSVVWLVKRPNQRSKY